MKKVLRTKKNLASLNLVIASMLASVSLQSIAEPLPPVDSGSLIQQIQPSLQAPESSTFNIEFNGNSLTELPAGGPQALLKKLNVGGLTVFTEDDVLGELGDVVDKSFDMAGYVQLANKISQFYRDRGYPFARAYIPPQTMQDGVLKIEVLEGKYDLTRVKSVHAIQENGQAYLSSIVSGEVIESSKLERLTLIMSDIPGYKALTSLSPGAKKGTANLNVLLLPKQQFSGDIAIDNQGSRYTGYNRIQAGIKKAHMVTFGDEINARIMYTDEEMAFGYLGYSLPIAPNGLRANFGVNHTQYSLGREYASLDAIGTADIFSLGISYPWIRSQVVNLTAKVGYERKNLMDFYRSADSKISKSSDSIPMSLSFDMRDQLLGGGVNFGELAFKVGQLTNDKNSLNTDGDFSKVTLDVARIQSLPASLSLFIKGSAQYSSKNLDSSEDLYVGGANAIRAYPPGEAGVNGGGDYGYYSQLELRYNYKEFTPYAFYDVGRINTSASPTQINPNETRDLAGGGLGLKYQRSGWSADVYAAWRTVGGAPVSDDKSDPTPRIVGLITYHFGSKAVAISAEQLTDGNRAE